MSNKQFEKKCKEDDQCLARIFFTDHTECGEQQKFRENFAKFAVRLVEILQQNLRSSSTKLWSDLRDNLLVSSCDFEHITPASGIPPLFVSARSRHGAACPRPDRRAPHYTLKK